MAYRSLLTLVVITQPVLLLQTGCDHYEPLKVRDSRMQEGPGLFSGEKGYFDLSSGLQLNDKTLKVKAKRPPEEEINTRRPLKTDLDESDSE